MTSPGSSALAARLRAMFAEELEDQLSDTNAHLLALEKNPSDAEELRSLFRVMHTLKGAARAANVLDVERVCHRLESMLAGARDEARPLTPDELRSLFEGVDVLSDARAQLQGEAAPTAPQPGTVSTDVETTRPAVDPPVDGTVRIGQDRIDALFAASNRLLILAAQLRAERSQALDGDGASSNASLRDRVIGRQLQRDVDRVAEEIARGVRELRMRPFADAVSDLPRAVRDIAAETGKSVRLEVEGDSVQADRAVLVQLREALLHLVRNAVDHGIEAPAKRRAAGKPAEGTIRIRASLTGDRIVVTVRDDGGGLDIAAIHRQLKARGDAVPEDDRAAARALFLGGISTRASASAISGRGVGLDAVRAAVERARGTVDVEWLAGQGTTFTLEAPLTLATVRAVLARVNGITVAIPTAFIDKMLRIPASELRVVEGRLAITTSEAPVTVASLAAVLGPPLVDRQPEGVVSLVVVRIGARVVALRVDELLEETEIVARPIRAHGRAPVPHVSGAALLAGGVVTLVLNVTATVTTALGLAGDVAAPDRAAAAPRRRVLVVDDSITTRTLEASVLEAAGYDVRTAVDGADGWRLLQEHGADLVVSDVEMPRMDGLQLTETIRASSRFRELPIILVTGLESAEHRSRGLEVGADAYLGKSSFEQEGLLTTVRELIG